MNTNKQKKQEINAAGIIYLNIYLKFNRNVKQRKQNGYEMYPDYRSKTKIFSFQHQQQQKCEK